jgi:hypothetical protein
MDDEQSAATDAPSVAALDTPAAGALPLSWVAAPALLGLLLVVRSVGFDFVNWDDPLYVTHNPRILDDSLGGLLTLWSPGAAYRGQYIEFFPLRDTLYWLVHALFGLKPWAFHLANVLLHAAVCAAVGPVLVRLGVPREGALVGALVFAAHPVHVESVAWVSGTKDPLYTLFALAVIGVWTRAETPTAIAKAAALLAAGLLVKAMIVVVPVQLFLYDVVLRRRSLAAALKRVGPLLVIAGLATLHFMAIGRANGVILPLKGGTWLSNTMTGLWSLTSYVSLLVLPLDLNPRYIVLPVTEVASLRGLTALAVTAILIGTVLGLMRQRPRVSFGLGFYLAGLITVLGLVPFNIEVADRYQYAASVGYAYLLGWAFVGLRARSGEVTARAVAAVVIVLLGVGTFRQTAVWRDSVSLWARVASQPQAQERPRLRYNYGLALLDAGRTEEAAAQLAILADAPLSPALTLPARVVLAKLALSVGNVAEAERRIGQPPPEQIGERFADDYALLALHLGETDRAAAYARQTTGERTPSWHALIAAAIADAGGDRARADAHLATSVAASAARCAPTSLRSLPQARQASLAPRLQALCVQSGQAPP